jgi:ketosteroid isomerase-like protein
MDERPIEIIRRVYERWAEGDFTAGGELYDEASVFVLSPEFPESGIYVGPDEMKKYMHGFLEPWEGITIECLDLSEAGDTVIAEVRQSGEGTRSGAATAFTYFQVWTLRKGTLTRLQNYMHRDQAYAAVSAAEG